LHQAVCIADAACHRIGRLIAALRGRMALQPLFDGTVIAKLFEFKPFKVNS
jgi:hypothetical protein